MDFISFIWTEGLLRPMLNLLLFFHSLFGNQFWLAILIFTVVMRLFMMPLTLRQLRSSRKLMSLQPRLQELQKRFAQDKQKLAQETMKAYRETGVSPLGCLGPMLLQFPIWIGLYQAIIKVLPTEPERLVGVSQKLYSWLPLVHRAVPLEGGFLWLELGYPDPTPILPVLVAASMWVLQKMSTLPTADPRQQSMNNMMQWMLPFMFGFFTFTFPSGLALYWVISNVISIVMQYFMTGWGGLATLWARRAPAPPTAPTPAPVEPSSSPPADREIEENGKRGTVRQNNRRSSRTGSQGARSPARRSGPRRPKSR